MTIHRRPYAGAADLQRILELKRACTTPENRYDAPTLSELRALLAPLPPDHRTASVGGRAWGSDSTPLPTSEDPAGDYGMRNEIGFLVLRTWEKRNASSFVFLNGTKTVRSGVYYFGSVLT